MKNIPIAAAATFAGLLMAACGGMHTASVAPSPSSAAPQDTITALERACLLEPTNAANWARLATALEADGQRERAARFYQQAATLAAHDARRDYALLAAAAPAAAASAAAATPAGAAHGPYADMPRTQVQQIGAALVQVVRVAAPPLVARMEPPAVSSKSVTAPSAPVQLEICNGNGVTGAAASLARVARTLNLDGVTTVRLTNARPFTVARTRIEYPHAQRAMAEELAQRLDIALKFRRKTAPHELRIVLGHDGGRGRPK
ncbi:LytR C-terminal domain-containing protein [Duganella phyllosphaerae]|uniref:LytR/CpsA/Psr regulator C-terminal domain-containing protein n=1 Tax=Duganella phyllosphaerae TaxID=762836 RepID=A0A1E7X7F5_9BURK|nr:LytR C-terminal domain-containing protein [Duganella phyllosphaerae]OFA09000.1 hypothetical protein DUPY_02420 [Duganella phyllosphaerae]